MKTLMGILKKYVPSAGARRILENGCNPRVSADYAGRALTMEADFPFLIPKTELYRIEDGIAEAYDLNYVKILPHYPPALFTAAYVPEILRETETVGVVARGFFRAYRHRLEGNRLIVEIPFADEGVALLTDARTPDIISRIIRSEFGLSVTVSIECAEDLSADAESSRTERLTELDRSLSEAHRAYTERQARQADAEREHAEAGADLPRRTTLFDGASGAEFAPRIRDGRVRVGFMEFDLSSPSFALGDPFAIQPEPIASLTEPKRSVVVLGEVFGFSQTATRTGDRRNITFYLTDNCASVEVRCVGLTPEKADAVAAVVRDGAALALNGACRHERKRDGSEEPDLVFRFRGVAVISRIRRADTADRKRVELHAHTQMSAMDALIPPGELVRQAKEWGHPAVAVTDHGNVQGFQEAMIAAEKIGMKVIYGMEAYFVNNTARALYGSYPYPLTEEAVVFDIETTGLSALNDRITEICAVRVRDGAVRDAFDTFVQPGRPIPEDIVKLTGITDEMVADAPGEAEALRAFFDFVGTKADGSPLLLIAHNADFDTGFLRAAASRLGLNFQNPYLDTLALSRFLKPKLKNHRLETVAEAYGLGDFRHHRASDDAGMLARIFLCMVLDLDEQDIFTYEALTNAMAGKTDPLNLRPCHQTILVRNRTGLKNLYRLVSDSYLKYFKRYPRIPKTELVKRREGLLIGSACASGELMRALVDNRPEADLAEIVAFYDYLEIQPVTGSRFLIDEGRFAGDDDLRELNRRIVELGERYGKPVVATCDAHFLNREDETARKILLAGMKYKDPDRDTGLYLRTTDEMLEEFSYLGREKAYEVVVENTNRIADSVEADVRPFPKGTFTPHIEGAEEDLTRMCRERALSLYGDPLPPVVGDRLNRELTAINENGYAVLYMIAQKLVSYSESQGYLVGSRGSVGSSVVAFLSGISEVNPLPPHYVCPSCRYSDFDTPRERNIRSGFDLPDALCPRCGAPLRYDGHDIPFETFLGFYGDKSPDIDLNFSGEVQGKVHRYTEELFGEENVFRAGTISALAEKTAYGFVMRYLEDRHISLSRAEINRLTLRCVGVKRTTGQHPGGIVVIPKEYDIYDFCPVQRPADDPNSDIVTTHFTFEYLHDTLLKLDELGHDIPTKYKYLEKYSDTSVLDVPMNDRSIYDLFLSTRPLGVTPEAIDCPLGTLGLPELGTNFVIRILQEARPQSFSDLLQISGLSHGIDVWTNNAQLLIQNGTCTVSEVIGTRDSIMQSLIRYGVAKSDAFKIMEMVRKGKGLTPAFEAEMRASQVPEWFISSCKKIKYMFPKAHAAAYDMSAIRLGWYKVHKPLAFYCAMFTVQPLGFDGELVMKGKNAVSSYIREVNRKGNGASPKEIQSLPVLQLVNEAYARGIRFLPVDLKISDDREFRPEGGNIRLPFSSLPGVGETAAANIVAARAQEPFFSIEDLQIRARLTRAVIDVLRRNRVLEGVSETDQMTIRF